MSELSFTDRIHMWSGPMNYHDHWYCLFYTEFKTIWKEEFEQFKIDYLKKHPEKDPNGGTVLLKESFLRMRYPELLEEKLQWLRKNMTKKRCRFKYGQTHGM